MAREIPISNPGGATPHHHHFDMDQPTRRLSLSMPIHNTGKAMKDIPRRSSMAKLKSSPISINQASSSHFVNPLRNNHSSNSSGPMNSYEHIGSSPASRMNRFAKRSDSAVLESDEEGSSTTSSSMNPKPQLNGPVSSSYGSVLDDATILKNVGKHLATDSDHSLRLQGGDITRDLYTIEAKSQQLRRTKTLAGTDAISERRDSSVSQLRIPGGFRRDFVMAHRRTKYGYTLNQPKVITRNFLEFLSIYGHFAGEDLEDEDFLACDYDTIDKHDEEMPLIDETSSQYSARMRTRISKPSSAGKASTLKSFFLLFKSFVGTGVLFLPKGFSNGGLLLSTGLLLFFAVLSYFCYLILVQSKVKTGVSSFGDIGGVLYGKQMKFIILASLILSQLGFVATYIVFTAENIHAFLYNAFGFDVGVGLLVGLESFFYVPMSLVRNITKLSLAALLANIFILIGICTIVYYAASDLITAGHVADIQMINGDKWTLFIGVAIFAFEGIGLIIPIQEAMRKPEDFPKVLFAVVAACVVLFIGIGALGYVTYGDDVKTVIILSLPQDSFYVILIQLFYPIAIMFSVPLQLLPAIRIVERRIFKRRSGKTDPVTKWEKNAFRIFSVALTTVIAYYGSADLDHFVSFVGCFACIPLVYMYPPLLHLKSCAKTTGSKILDISIIVLGSIALCYTTYQILLD